MSYRDKERIDKIVRSLELKVSSRDLSHTDPRVRLSAICSRWLPLAPAILGIVHHSLINVVIVTLDMVVSKLPSPLQMTPERVEKLMCSSEKSFGSFPPETQQLKEG